MKDKDIGERFFDFSLRAELIIHIPTQFLEEYLPSEVEDAFDLDFEEIFKAIGIKAPDERDNEEISYYLRENNVTGWLVKFATPKPQRFTKGGFSMSWGYYGTQWIYDLSYENACERAIKWQNEFVESHRKKK